MTELPDFTGYEPVELSQIKQGDVVAAVLNGNIAHGEVSYSRPNAVDIGNVLSTTDTGDYKFFLAPKQLPTGECAVIEYTMAMYRKRAVLMGGSWFVFEVYSTGGENTTWDTASYELYPVEMQETTKDGFTVIFEGVKK